MIKPVSSIFHNFDNDINELGFDSAALQVLRLQYFHTHKLISIRALIDNLYYSLETHASQTKDDDDEE